MGEIESQEQPAVYLIEDDANFRASIDAALTSRNLPLHTFSSAEEFKQSVTADPEGCLIIDLSLPGMNGIELLKWVRARDWKVPAVILSGTVTIPDALLAVENGVLDVLRKPISLTDLLKTVDAAMSIRPVQDKQSDLELRRVLSRLSQLEIAVLSMILDGLPNKTIASRLDMGLRSVVRARQNLLKQFGFGTVPELAIALGRAGVRLTELPKVDRFGAWSEYDRGIVRDRLKSIVGSLDQIRLKSESDSHESQCSTQIEAITEDLGELINGTELTPPSSLLKRASVILDLPNEHDGRLLHDLLRSHGYFVLTCNEEENILQMLADFGDSPPEFVLTADIATLSSAEFVRKWNQDAFRDQSRILAVVNNELTDSGKQSLSQDLQCEIIRRPLDGLAVHNRISELLHELRDRR